MCSAQLKATRHPKVKVHKRNLYKHLPKISFSKCKLVIPCMAEGDFILLLHDSLCLFAPNSPINTSARSFETVHGHVFIYAHSLPSYWVLGHGLSCQAKFHPKQFLNTHPINPLQRELVMEILTETWRDSRAAIAAYYTSASLAADPSLRHLHFPLVYLG